MKKISKKKEEQLLAEKLLIEEVKKDFENRRNERRRFEAQWILNLNFLVGNQYSVVSRTGDIENIEKNYRWQYREVFNHITPIVERRLSKLQTIRPAVNVFPVTSDDRDVKCAKITKKIINSVFNQNKISKIITEATEWSEICGTSFYKVVWNASKGMKLANLEKGGELKAGDVEVVALSPFEVYPDSSSSPDLTSCRSVIHARAYHIDEIKNLWGIEVEGADVNVFTLDKCMGIAASGKSASIQTTKSNYAIVIERYESPSVKYPHGRLVIVCEDKLLHVSELPYVNGQDGARIFPFIRQTSISRTGMFWGTSVIERLIPLQRTLNALKNRKYEFINRLSMGVLTVEDGSVDIDALEEEGLRPGKVVLYRNGATPPKYLESESLPIDFSAEEKSLMDEFADLSGVSDFSSNSYLNKNLSGVALELLIEQDESKIKVTSDSIKESIKEIAEHVLKLYKQFVKIPKLIKVIGDGGDIEMFYFTSNDITTDDICFETKDETSDTLAQRREMIFKLLNAGLLSNEKGELSIYAKNKILEMLGYGVWENMQDLDSLHSRRAGRENNSVVKGDEIEVLSIDNHEVHINEHTAFVLGSEIEKLKNRELVIEKLVKHIELHKRKLPIQKETI